MIPNLAKNVSKGYSFQAKYGNDKPKTHVSSTMTSCVTILMALSLFSAGILQVYEFSSGMFSSSKSR